MRPRDFAKKYFWKGCNTFACRWYSESVRLSPTTCPLFLDFSVWDASLMMYFDSVVVRLVMVFALALLPTETSRADIVWQTPKTISGDSDVSNFGIGIRAWSFSSTTVNGVSFFSGGSFAPVNAPSGGSGFGGSSTVFGAMSDEYKVLLNSATFNASNTGFENEPGRMAINLTGLTSGKLYEFQAFVNDSRNSTGDFNSDRWNVFDSGAGTAQSQSVLQPYLTGNSNIGQYIKGTFTANGDSQLIRISGNATFGPKTSLINAYQLRELASVPEPTSLLLVASITAMGFVAKRTSRRSRKG